MDKTLTGVPGRYCVEMGILGEGKVQHLTAKREDSRKGAAMYCSIMSVIETVKHSGLNCNNEENNEENNIKIGIDNENLCDTIKAIKQEKQ